jgi:hypothetical protein
VALNDGYAVDAQGRRIYFPPIGQPRLVPSTLDEARFNGAVFTYALITFGLGFVLLLTASAAYGEYAGLIWVLASVLVVYPLAASLRARRWPALDDPNYTYHRFVISTLRRQNTAWLRCKLIASAMLSIGLVVVAAMFAIKLQSEWATWSLGNRVDRLLISPSALAAGAFCAIHAYRIHVALRRQKELRASGSRDGATNANV